MGLFGKSEEEKQAEEKAMDEAERKEDEESVRGYLELLTKDLPPQIVTRVYPHGGSYRRPLFLQLMNEKGYKIVAIAGEQDWSAFALFERKESK